MRIARRKVHHRSEESRRKLKSRRMGECTVCCTTFTSEKRKPVACPGCSFRACCECVKRYLLTSSSDPCCMNCGLYWARPFLDSISTAAWRNGLYRTHRRQVLLDRERALLPAVQPLVKQEVMRRERLKERKEALRKLQRARQILREAQGVYAATFRALDTEAPQERRDFVAACPTAECRGFLSTQYKCGTCLRQFCAKCREGIDEQQQHVCNEDVVKSMELIARDSKPCPACGMAIHRVSGCDHMFCTSCDTGFSYATGQRISDKANTNPHMYERLRQLAATAQGDRQSEWSCDGTLEWPDIYHLYRLADFLSSEMPFFRSMHQTARHVERIVLPMLPTGRADTTDLRVKFCLEDLDQESFAARLQQLEKKREQQLETRQILETFVVLAFEFFTKCASDVEGTQGTRPSAASIEAKRRACTDFAKSIEEVVNVPLQALSNRYTTRSPRIITIVDDQRLPRTLYEPLGHQPQKRHRAEQRL